MGCAVFLFMVFAAMSTVFGVCENLLAMIRELTGWSRPVGCIACGIWDVSCGIDNGAGVQSDSFSAVCKRHGMAGFVGFYCV